MDAFAFVVNPIGLSGDLQSKECPGKSEAIKACRAGATEARHRILVNLRFARLRSQEEFIFALVKVSRSSARAAASLVGGSDRSSRYAQGFRLFWRAGAAARSRHYATRSEHRVQE